MSILELLAALLGLAAVALTIARSVWCWPIGLMQVSLYTKVFFDAKLYSQTWLQLVFAILQVHGWWQWRQSLRHDQSRQSVMEQVRVEQVRVEQVRVEQLTPLGLLLSLGIALLVSFSLGQAMQQWTDAAWAMADATIAGLSLVAQWLLIGRYLQNWYFWIVVNLLTIIVCTAQGLWPTVVLYCVFLVMASGGLRAWHAQWKRQQVKAMQCQSASTLEPLTATVLTTERQG